MMSKLKPLVSVVVTAYNVGPYLNSCLNALINQSYSNLEIILVNDGSTDETESIGLQYQKKYRQVTFISQPHRGYGPTANAGIKLAKGKYLMFCDGDDYYLPESVTHMFMAISRTNSDIVIASGLAINPENNELIHDNYVNYLHLPLLNSQDTLTPAEIAHFFPLIPVFAWTKIYNLKWLHQQKIEYPDVPFDYVDNPFHCLLLAKVNRLSLLREQICVHRIKRPGSATIKINAESLIKAMLISRSIIRQYRPALLSGFYHTLFVNWQYTLALNPKTRTITRQLAREVIQESVKLDPETYRVCRYFTSKSLMFSVPLYRFFHSLFQFGKQKLTQWF